MSNSLAAYKAQFSKNRWLTANDRIAGNNAAALHLLSKFSESEKRAARRTIVCAAGFNTPLWQNAVSAVAGNAQGVLL